MPSLNRAEKNKIKQKISEYLEQKNIETDKSLFDFIYQNMVTLLNESNLSVNNLDNHHWEGYVNINLWIKEYKKCEFAHSSSSYVGGIIPTVRYDDNPDRVASSLELRFTASPQASPATSTADLPAAAGDRSERLKKPIGTK